jgi:hypothetical protein
VYSVKPTCDVKPASVATVSTLHASPTVVPAGAVHDGVVVSAPVTATDAPVLACSTVVRSVAPDCAVMDNDRDPAVTV